jgi:hypothetical protein
MSVLNLALSNCALSRKLMGDEFEKNMKKCTSMTSVRKLADKLVSLVDAVVAAPLVVDAPAEVVDDDIATDVDMAPTTANICATGTFG